METSCTYVASAEWINDAVVLGSLIVAVVGCDVLGTLRDRRLAAELGEDGAAPTSEVSLANA